MGRVRILVSSCILYCANTESGLAKDKPPAVVLHVLVLTLLTLTMNGMNRCRKS